MLRILFGLLTALLWAAPAAAGEMNSFAVRDVRVFDGERTLQHRTVVVRDGRICLWRLNAKISFGIEPSEGGYGRFEDHT